MSVRTSSKSVRSALARDETGRSSRRGILQAIAAIMLLLVVSTAVWLSLRFDPFGSVHADFDRGRHIAALGAAEDYLKRWPGDPRASLLAARCATRMGQPQRAENHYAHAGSLGLEDLQDRAYGLVLMNQPDRAAGLYGQILEERPDDPLALKRLAAVLMGQKRYAKLPDIAGRLIAIPGEAVAGWTLSGIAHHVDRRYPEAAADFRKVLELDPELKLMPLPVTLFWNHLAIDLLAQGKFAEARAHLVQGLADSQDAGLTELLGTTYQQEGKADEAEHYWRLAVQRDPNQHEALLDLGNLAISRRRPEEAVSLLSRVAELVPDMVEPYQNLSVAYKLLGKAEESERFRKLAADLRAKSPGGERDGDGRARDRDAATSAIGLQR